MTFGAPGALFALALLPVLVGWYVAQQRARRRAQAAFVTTTMFASVAPRRSSWRRHVPLTAVLLAVALLVLAAAKPQRTVAVAAERASILLATDVSGSMLATDVAPNRLKAAQAAAKAFVANVPKRVNVGVMAFNQAPQLLQSPTTDRAAINEAIDLMHSSGTTATGEAIQAATQLLTGRTGAAGKRPPAAIVLLSDGASRRGVDPLAAARAAGDAKVPVYLERVLVALLARGHLLVEGVPGPRQDADREDARARRCAARSSASSSRPTSCRPTSSARASTTRRPASSTSLGPVFCNLLLADEINRAPAKVQSALLEVMQERQVTIGARRTRCPSRSSSWRRRTRSRPRAPTRCPRRRSTAS
jgi:hypothetical protein